MRQGHVHDAGVNQLHHGGGNDRAAQQEKAKRAHTNEKLLYQSV
jgi:hypothetical protein